MAEMLWQSVHEYLLYSEYNFFNQFYSTGINLYTFSLYFLKFA